MAEKEFVENIAEEIVEMISNTKKVMALSQDIENVKTQQKECFKNINRLENKIRELEKAAMAGASARPKENSETYDAEAEGETESENKTDRWERDI
jgi:septal ring factor EnvC (AmiA/AmiB activator)